MEESCAFWRSSELYIFGTVVLGSAFEATQPCQTSDVSSPAEWHSRHRRRYRALLQAANLRKQEGVTNVGS
jgi:hypothetical protein